MLRKVGSIGLRNVSQPSLAHCRTELISQIINQFRNCSTFIDPNMVRKTQINANLSTSYNKSNNINNFNKHNNQNNIQRIQFKTWTFLMKRPCISTLQKCNTKQNQTRAELHYTKGQRLHVAARAAPAAAALAAFAAAAASPSGEATASAPDSSASSCEDPALDQDLQEEQHQQHHHP